MNKENRKAQDHNHRVQASLCPCNICPKRTPCKAPCKAFHAYIRSDYTCNLKRQYRRFKEAL